MSYGRATSLVALALLTAASQLRAGETAEVRPGVRVRVTSPALGHRALVGSVIAFDEEALTLAIQGSREPTMILREEIRTIAVSQGRESRAKGALLGLLAGAAVGAVVGAASGDDSNWCCSSGEMAKGLGLVGAAAGALIGVTITPGERWETLPADRLRVSLAPVKGRGIGVRVTIPLAPRRAKRRS